MESRDVLIIDQLRLRRGAREILRGVTFSANRGELLALMGLSGGGKTTVMRCVAALEPFDSGLISVDGVMLRPGPLPPRSAMRELRKRVGMVFQLHYLFEHLTASQNVTLAPVHVLHINRSDADARAAALLDSLGVAHRRNALPQAAKRSGWPSPGRWPWIRRCC